MQTLTVHIDLRQLADLAHTGVRRAVLFMGLGLNAAHRLDFRDYQLHKLPIVPGQTGLPIEFFPDDLPPERVDEFKKEFAVWVTGCGLRELMEHYALFLDQIHRSALAVFQQHGKLNQIGNPEKAHREFHRRLGIPDKLRVLKAQFGIEPADADSIAALYEARNCLTHDFGNVMAKRCNDGDTFVMTWRAMDIVARGVGTGNEVPLTELIGNATSEETSILVKAAQRRKVLKAGSKLRFSQQDLWEICYFFNAHAIPSMIASFVKFLKGHDVPVVSAQDDPTGLK